MFTRLKGNICNITLCILLLIPTCYTTRQSSSRVNRTVFPFVDPGPATPIVGLYLNTRICSRGAQDTNSNSNTTVFKWM